MVHSDERPVAAPRARAGSPRRRARRRPRGRARGLDEQRAQLGRVASWCTHSTAPTRSPSTSAIHARSVSGVEPGDDPRDEPLEALRPSRTRARRGRRGARPASRGRRARGRGCATSPRGSSARSQLLHRGDRGVGSRALVEQRPDLLARGLVEPRERVPRPRRSARTRWRRRRAGTERRSAVGLQPLQQPAELAGVDREPSAQRRRCAPCAPSSYSTRASASGTGRRRRRRVMPSGAV